MIRQPYQDQTLEGIRHEVLHAIVLHAAGELSDEDFDWEVQRWNDAVEESNNRKELQ